MRFRQFLLPGDTFFSTPKAARKLLRLLAGVVLACLAIALFFYLSTAFNHQVSQHRRAMNAAMYEAQLYLYKREALITYLNRGVLFRAVEPLRSMSHLEGPLSGHSYVNQPLGDPARGWSLLLSGRDLQELDDKRLNLLYVVPGAPAAVHRLHDAFSASQAVPAPVLDELIKDVAEEEASRVRWLSDPNDNLARVYLFTRIANSPDAGWLGIEARGADLKSSLEMPQAGRFQLLDQMQGQVVGSQPMVGGKAFRGFWVEDSFAFAGAGLFPSRLELLKHIGSSEWALIYYVQLDSLLAPLWWPILLALCLGASGWVAVWRLCRRIDARLIGPAQQRLEALVENESFLSAVIDTSPVALCVLRRADGQVTLENSLAQQWLGDVQERRLVYEGIVRYFTSSQGGSGFKELELADGRHLYLSCRPTRYQREEVLFCAFSDISLRKAAEAELARAKQLADSANEAKTQFLATMSHEIRTPLYGVLGTLELLGRSRLDSQQQSYLYAIQRSSMTLQQLISDVLDVSKIEAGQLALKSVDFSPLELLQEVLQSYAAAARSKGLQIFACGDAQLPERVRGDVHCLRQILNNLLSNALKFTDSGRVVLRARVEGCDASGLSLSWQVTDTGMGISVAEQPRLFDPFYQVGGQARRPGGTGLGLSICMRLAELMGGQLKVVSEVGLGSSFTLTLPLEAVPVGAVPSLSLGGAIVYVHTPVRELSENLCGWLARWGARAQLADGRSQVAEEALLLEVRLAADGPRALADWPGCRVVVSEEGDQKPRRQGREWLVGPYDLGSLHQAVAMALGETKEEPRLGEEPSAMPALGLCVLVAEDNAINQMILRDQLETLGCTVEMVCDGQQALQSWQERHFDAVLTDINMPRMNGYELAGELRRRGCVIPIIGATANAMHDENQRCLDAGMDLCLVKPVDLDALHRCLASFHLEV